LFEYDQFKFGRIRLSDDHIIIGEGSALNGEGYARLYDSKDNKLIYQGGMKNKKYHGYGRLIEKDSEY